MFIPIAEYAKRHNKTKAWIYLAIRLGKVPADKIRKIALRETLQIDEDFTLN